MPDKKQQHTDKEKIDTSDIEEIKYLHGLYPNLTEDDVKAAIEFKGPLRSSVMEYLQSEKARHSS